MSEKKQHEPTISSEHPEHERPNLNTYVGAGVGILTILTIIFGWIFGGARLVHNWDTKELQSQVSISQKIDAAVQKVTDNTNSKFDKLQSSVNDQFNAMNKSINDLRDQIKDNKIEAQNEISELRRELRDQAAEQKLLAYNVNQFRIEAARESSANEKWRDKRREESPPN